MEAAHLIRELLDSCPRLAVLVTSRKLLRLAGETAVPVYPLPLPDHLTSLAEILASDAVQLFLARATTADPHLAVTETNARVIAQICRRLGGLPLAIELAAARCRILSPPAILSRLEVRLPLLGGGPRDQPARLRTMRDAIAWSYDVLDPAQQRLFRCLSVFVGGFTIEAASAVCELRPASSPLPHPKVSWSGRVTHAWRGASLPDEPGMSSPAQSSSAVLLDEFTSLLDQSLIYRFDGDAGEPRFGMLETIREFGLERLAACHEADVTRDLHMTYFTTVAEKHAPYLPWQVEVGAAVARLDAELDNFRAALAWSAKRDPSDSFLRLAAALESFWIRRGFLAEARAWLDSALESCLGAPVPLQAAVARAAAWVARHRGDPDLAQAFGAAGLVLSRHEGDSVAVIHALTILGFVAEDRGEFPHAIALHQEALTLGLRLDLPVWVAWSMRNLGRVCHLQGDLDSAERWLVDSLNLFQREYHLFGAAYVQSELAEVALIKGDVRRAAMLWQHRLALSWDEWGLQWCLEGLGAIALACREAECAARLLGAVAAHCQRMGVDRTPAQQARMNHMIEQVRLSLGEAALWTAWEAGWRLTAAEARAAGLQFARKIAMRPWQDKPAVDSVLSLTRRELEIVRLVATGRSNQEIAEMLCISIPTVKRHLTNVFGKIGLPSRSALTAYAFRHGLL